MWIASNSHRRSQRWQPMQPIPQTSRVRAPRSRFEQATTMSAFLETGTITLRGQTATHCIQPVHFSASTRATPSTTAIAPNLHHPLQQEDAVVVGKAEV